MRVWIVHFFAANSVHTSGKQIRLFRRQIGERQPGQQALKIHGSTLAKLKHALQINRRYQFPIAYMGKRAFSSPGLEAKPRNGCERQTAIEALGRPTVSN